VQPAASAEMTTDKQTTLLFFNIIFERWQEDALGAIRFLPWTQVLLFGLIRAAIPVDFQG
jgi:hypothetical protein